MFIDVLDTPHRRPRFRVNGDDGTIHQELGGCHAHFWFLACACKPAHHAENLPRFSQVNFRRCLVLEEHPERCDGLSIRGVWIHGGQQKGLRV